MNLELHHFFILVEPKAEVAELLVELGLSEGEKNTHEGQGTSNRLFYFSNGMLEFLWIHNEDEAINGPGSGLLFAERRKELNASPFGVIFTRKNNSTLDMPFNGWKYTPDYFEPPWAFHVGENSSNIDEPLCLYMPFIEPATSASPLEEGTFKSISQVNISIPSEPISNVLGVVGNAERFSINHGNQHLMELTLDDKRSGKSQDFRPDIPLILNW